MVVVSHPQHLDEVRQLLPPSQHPKLRAVVAGGAERQDSTLNALRALEQVTDLPFGGSSAFSSTMQCAQL